jgi:hypothetical protein
VWFRVLWFTYLLKEQQWLLLLAVGKGLLARLVTTGVSSSAIRTAERDKSPIKILGVPLEGGS